MKEMETYHNVMVFKGATSRVLALISDAIANCGRESGMYIHGLYGALQELDSCEKTRVVGSKHSFRKPSTGEEIGIGTLETFLPMPETFLKYDTSDYPTEYPEAVIEQYEEYSVIGWKAWEKKYLGCRNAQVTYSPIVSDNGTVTELYVYCTTQDGYPDKWAEALAAKHSLHWFLLTETDTRSGAKLIADGRTVDEAFEVLLRTRLQDNALKRGDSNESLLFSCFGDDGYEEMREMLSDAYENKVKLLKKRLHFMVEGCIIPYEGPFVSAEEGYPEGGAYHPVFAATMDDFPSRGIEVARVYDDGMCLWDSSVLSAMDSPAVQNVVASIRERCN